MQLRKIIILGNSVALRNRPHTKEKSLNYGQIIENELNLKKQEQLVLVNNLAFGRATMRDLDKIQDQIINSFGDLYIINIGVSDAATREMPRWFADILNRREQSFKVRLVKAISVAIFIPFRTTLVKLRGKRSWTSTKKFEKLFAELIHRIQHNTSGKIIVLPLNEADERIEKIVPGTSKKYIKFNGILSNICDQTNVDFLDLGEIDSKVHYPDGTHFSEEGNKYVAEKILNLIYEKEII